jgi:hypothetical protein
MHISNKVSPELLSHFFKMIADGAIMESDIREFCNDPLRWRKFVQVEKDLSLPPLLAEAANALTQAMASRCARKEQSRTLETAQTFWQSIYDELLGAGKVTVPSVPTLTEKQVKSLDKFGFMLVYVPALKEDQYPEGFVKPAWSQYLNVASITRKPLKGKWIAVETIAKPHYDDRAGYPNDRLMAAVGKTTRFNTSWDDLTNGLLAEIAKVTGFPKKGTHLPTAEEWNLIANLFNWLREHRSMNLPDLGSTRSWEWCENAYVAGRRLVVGSSDDGGLAVVYDDWHDGRFGDFAFRVLADL